MKKNLFLTFDIEEWYHVNYKGFKGGSYNDITTNLDAQVDHILELCESFKVKSTCFVLGCVAKKKPQLIRKIIDAGHEIANHGLNHKLIYNMNPDEFKEDILQSTYYLEDIIGQKIIGFRAPSWSINKNDLEWYYDILEQFGYKYSSSIYPARTYLFGIVNHQLELHRPVINNKKWDIVEIPVPLIAFPGMKIGFSGGFFFRLMPYFLIKKELRKKLKEYPATFIYLHPRELGLEQQEIDLPLVERFIHYYGIEKCGIKLQYLLSEYNQHIIRISDYLLLQGFL